MEFDDSSKCRKNKNKGINLFFSKDSNNQNWLVTNKSRGRNNSATSKVRKRTLKPKNSLKICLPIIHYLRVMQKDKNCNAEKKAPSPNQIETRRPPQQMGPPPVERPLSLRMFRHPVPTSRGRVMLADKLEQIIKSPKPICNKATKNHFPSMPRCIINTPPIEEPVNKKTKELNTSESKPNTTTSFNSNIDVPISMKHKLPLSVVAPKCSYDLLSSNPVNKENRLNISKSTQTTVGQATQTEKVFIVHEEAYKILETIKNKGLTYEYLQNQIENFQKGNETKKNNDSLVIDLENTEEEPTPTNKDNNADKDILATVMKHSISNKNVLNSVVQIMHTLLTQNRQPLAPATVPSSEGTPSTSDQQPILTGPGPPIITEPPNFRPIPYVDMVNSFMILQTLQKFGYRLTNPAFETPQTDVQITPKRADLQTSHSATQTGDENDNSKRRKLHATVDENSSALVNHLQQNNFQGPSVVVGRSAQEFSGLIPQQQELSIFQPQPQQLPQMQIQQFVPEHVERSARMFPSNLPNLIQRNQFIMSRSHNQYPFDQNRNTSQIQVQMPSPVQTPRYNDPRRQSLSRVHSTQEANMHGHSVQHPEYNWSFPRNRNGNAFSQRH